MSINKLSTLNHWSFNEKLYEITYHFITWIIIIIIMNSTADQSCNHAVSMSSKHAENLRD
jgi:hypothetical protein